MSTLSFEHYVGGPDAIQIESAFPSSQRTMIYNFGKNVTGWTFTADYQTLVVDKIGFNRLTGEPNFAESTVIGSFPKVDITGDAEPSVIDYVAGNVAVTIPAGMYSGPIIPDARQNVPIAVFSFTWQDAQTPAQISTHRWALLQSWEPDVVIGDPTTDGDYTALSV